MEVIQNKIDIYSVISNSQAAFTIFSSVRSLYNKDQKYIT